MRAPVASAVSTEPMVPSQSSRTSGCRIRNGVDQQHRAHRRRHSAGAVTMTLTDARGVTFELLAERGIARGGALVTAFNSLSRSLVDLEELFSRNSGLRQNRSES
jgi:hypothetical protein